MLNGLPVIKLVVHAAASLGVQKIVADVIKNNTTIKSTFDQARYLAGSTVIGLWAVDKASDYVDERMDDATRWMREKKEEKEDDTKPVAEKWDPEKDKK